MQLAAQDARQAQAFLTEAIACVCKAQRAVLAGVPGTLAALALLLLVCARYSGSPCFTTVSMCQVLCQPLLYYC